MRYIGLICFATAFLMGLWLCTFYFVPNVVWVEGKAYHPEVRGDTLNFTIPSGAAKGEYRIFSRAAEQYNVWVIERREDGSVGHQWHGVTKEQYEALPDWGFAIWRNPE